MSNISPEEYSKRTELLKTARQLLTQDYIARRTEGHKQWIANSETSWRINGALLPYPTGSLYPTEAEIVAKALELYNLASPAPVIQSAPPPSTVAVSIPLPEAPPPSQATFSTEPANNVVEQLQAVYRKVDATLPVIPPLPATTPWEDMLAAIPEPTTSPIVEEPVVEVASVIEEPLMAVEEPVVEAIPEEAASPKIVEDTIPEVVIVEPEVKSPPKNSLLRNVLSSWLQKNKDNSQ